MQKKSQAEKFIKAAKEHNCDENEAAFEKKLKELSKAGQKPAKKVKDD